MRAKVENFQRDNVGDFGFLGVGELFAGEPALDERGGAGVAHRFQFFPRWLFHFRSLAKRGTSGMARPIWGKISSTAWKRPRALISSNSALASSCATSRPKRSSAVFCAVESFIRR